MPYFRQCKYGLLMFGVMLLLVLLVQTVSFACPTCKDGLAENDPSGAGLVRGYFWSIVFMMSMPFLILAGLSSYFYFEICRARRQLTAAEAAA